MRAVYQTPPLRTVAPVTQSLRGSEGESKGKECLNKEKCLPTVQSSPGRAELAEAAKCPWWASSHSGGRSGTARAGDQQAYASQ